jgi:hypothetical protein
MKTTAIRIIWGFVLVAVGGLALADRLGYVGLDLVTTQGWSIIFAIASGAFFLSYILAGIRNWGWLFPALVFAALALVLGVLLDQPYGTLIAMPILLSIGIPFYMGYLVDRKQWGLLIPAWVLTVISLILFLAEGPYSDLIGALVLFAIAAPFFIVYLARRQHMWALIVGSILAFIGLFPLLGPILPEEIAGPVIMFILTLPFIILFFSLKQAWWALIPAGIFASIGVVALLDTLLPNHQYFMISGLQFGGYTSVLFLGFAITFGILWLLRRLHPTAWAIYPAIGLLVLSILAFLMWKTASNLVLPLALLVIGAVMISAAVIKRDSSHQPVS